MTDKDGKDGSGTGDSAGDHGTAVVHPDASTAPAATKNKAAKISMDQAYAEIENLQRVNGEKDSLIADLTRQLDEANKVLESQEKGRLIGEILLRSSYKIDELVGRSAEELQQIRATLDQAMPPKVNSVRFGVAGADLSDRERGLTVGDLSWETAQKRKGAS
jgi:predicted ribosome quality control (RQC) complex YloA/Tae2 family protein